MPAGSVITNEMLTVKRPGTGIPPKYMGWIVGRTAKQNISIDSLVSWEVL
ncbi:SAF domain-containing protein [Citrobacter koseri]